jgi:hypothetical protein
MFIEEFKLPREDSLARGQRSWSSRVLEVDNEDLIVGQPDDNRS